MSSRMSYLKLSQTQTSRRKWGEQKSVDCIHRKSSYGSADLVFDFLTLLINSFELPLNLLNLITLQTMHSFFDSHAAFHCHLIMMSIFTKVISAEFALVPSLIINLLILNRMETNSTRSEQNQIEPTQSKPMHLLDNLEVGL